MMRDLVGSEVGPAKEGRKIDDGPEGVGHGKRLDQGMLDRGEMKVNLKGQIPTRSPRWVEVGTEGLRWGTGKN